MFSKKSKYFRIIGISPSRWGFGFAVLEGHTLVDWDAKTTSKDKSPWCVKEVNKLIQLYSPDVMIFYDHSIASKRSERVRRLNRRLVVLAKKRKLPVEMVAPGELIQSFFPDGGKGKYDVAKTLAQKFPDELASRLPPKRMPWMNQDRRMDIFDAAALATALRLQEKWKTDVNLDDAS